jgi:hypothetical protein
VEREPRVVPARQRAAREPRVVRPQAQHAPDLLHAPCPAEHRLW